jgi:hypothetical protein
MRFTEIRKTRKHPRYSAIYDDLYFWQRSEAWLTGSFWPLRREFFSVLHDALEANHDALRTNGVDAEADHDALGTNHVDVEADDDALGANHVDAEPDHDALRTNHFDAEADHDALETIRVDAEADHDALETNHVDEEANHDALEAKPFDKKPPFRQNSALSRPVFPSCHIIYAGIRQLYGVAATPPSQAGAGAASSPPSAAQPKRLITRRGRRAHHLRRGVAATRPNSATCIRQSGGDWLGHLAAGALRAVSGATRPPVEIRSLSIFLDLSSQIMFYLSCS